MLELTRSADIRDLGLGLTRVDSQNPSISLTRLLTNETWSRVSLHINLWYRYCFLIASTLVSLGTLRFLKGGDVPVSNSSRSSSEISKCQFSPFSDRDVEEAKTLTDRDIFRWFGVTVRHLDCLFPDESWLYRANSYLIHLEQQVRREQIMAEVFKARRWTITSSKLCRFKMQARLAWGRKYINYTALFFNDKMERGNG